MLTAEQIMETTAECFYDLGGRFGFEGKVIQRGKEYYLIVYSPHGEIEIMCNPWKLFIELHDTPRSQWRWLIEVDAVSRVAANACMVQLSHEDKEFFADLSMAMYDEEERLYAQNRG